MLRRFILSLCLALYASAVSAGQSQVLSQSVPTTMAVGHVYPVSVTLKNVGTETWSPVGSSPQCNVFRLGSTNPQDNLIWGRMRADLPTTVAPGGQVTLDFNVTAPSTPGTYNFQWRMLQECVTWFGDFTPNVVVIVAPPRDAQVLSQSVPTTMAVGHVYPVSVTLKNVGAETWSPVGSSPQCNVFRLGSANPQGNLTWGRMRADLPTTVAPGGQVTLDFNVTAPSTPGTYNFQWRMLQECVTWFGDFTPNVAVTVAAAQCRVDQRFGPTSPPSSLVYKADLNENLGDWGTIFMAADTDTGACLARTRDFLKYKLKSQNQVLSRWKGGLMGGDVFLVTAAALRLGTKGLLTSEIHSDILTALADYDFAHWGGPCGRSTGNGCMDDYTVAAAGHAWAGTYLWWTQSSTWNGRDSGWFRGEAKRYIKLSISPKDTLCVRPLSETMCAACRNEYSTDYDDDSLTPMQAASLRDEIASDQVEVLSFEHGYENPSYGVGLLTVVSTAIQGLKVAGDSYAASEFQKAMVHGLFRTGQSHAPTNATVCQASWLNNCVGLNCSMPGAHCLSGNCDPPLYGCADDPGDRAYTADMFPVKPLLDDASAFEFDPTYGIVSPILGSPSYQFTGFCSSRFTPTASFLHDARYAGYYQIPYVWRYVSQPPVQGVNPVQHVDFPKPPSMVPPQPVTGTTTFSGWAFDGEGTLSTASLSFTLDGQPYALQNFFYGGSRQDVCNAYGLTNQGSCLLGWSGSFTPPPGFTTGTHVLVVTVRSANGLSTSTFRREFIYQP